MRIDLSLGVQGGVVWNLEEDFDLPLTPLVPEVDAANDAYEVTFYEQPKTVVARRRK